MTQLDCRRKWGEKTKANPEIQTVQSALDILDLPKKRSRFLRNRLRKSQSAVMSRQRPVAPMPLGGGWDPLAGHGPPPPSRRPHRCLPLAHWCRGWLCRGGNIPLRLVAHDESNKTKVTWRSPVLRLFREQRD